MSLLLRIFAAPAVAQLDGVWEITANNCCTDPDGQTDCDVTTLSIPVTRAGSRLSGSVVLSDDTPEGCSVTCTPATSNCSLQINLEGTVSDRGVDVTLTSQQTAHADCGMCVVQEHYSESAHLQGEVTGATIAGSSTDQSDFSCSAAGAPGCEDIIDCSGQTCSGTFQVLVGGSVATPCTGDCDASGDVPVNEIITMVNIAQDSLPVSECQAGDANADGTITVDEIIAAVNNALTGCAQ